MVSAVPLLQNLQFSRHNRSSICQCQSGCHLFHRCIREYSFNLRKIHLIHMLSRCQKAVSQVSVIGQEQQALRVNVQTPNRE